MRNILLFVSYDGTDFCGWQRQDIRLPRYTASGHSATMTQQSEPPSEDAAVPTVQGALESALYRLHKCPTSVCGSGRTDSGVHALSQAVTFTSPIDSIPVEHYPRAINSFLPTSIRVTEAKEAEADFSARFSATSRVYRYFISESPLPDAFCARYSWCVHRTLDIDLLNALSGELHGETDCASFAASEGNGVGYGFVETRDTLHSGALNQRITSRSTCRYIEGMRFFRQAAWPSGEVVVFEIEANAFLYHMVRNLVGTLLFLERKGAASGSLRAIARARERAKAGPTAPANGLFLWEVKFDGVRRYA